MYMYEMCLHTLQNSFPLASVSLKKGQHTEHWPWSVEILHRQETIHASLACERDMNSLVECVGRQEGVPNKVGSHLNCSQCIHIYSYTQYNYVVHILAFKGHKLFTLHALNESLSPVT